MPFDPFLLLGLPRRFDLDPSEIEAAFLARAYEAHPDAAVGKLTPGRESDGSAQAELNAAKDILMSPERRAGSLLELLGGPTKEQNKSLPEGFLADMMEMRAEMEAALGANDPRELARWRARGELERARWMGEAARRFGDLGVAGGTRELAEIRTTLNAWRYIERLIEQIDTPERTLP